MASRAVSSENSDHEGQTEDVVRKRAKAIAGDRFEQDFCFERVYLTPEFKGLPKKVDVQKIAQNRKIDFEQNSFTVQKIGNVLHIPRYYTMRDANAEIAKAIVSSMTLPEAPVADQADKAAAWASVLCLPADEFREFDKKICEDQPLANLFDVPIYFVDMRRKMLEMGF